MYVGTRVFLLLCMVGYICATPRKYVGYSVWEIIPSNGNQLSLLRNVQARHNELEFFSEPSVVGQTVMVMLPPEVQEEFRGLFTKNDIRFTVAQEDIQSQLNQEQTRIHEKRSKRDTATSYDWGDFNDYKSIFDEIDNMAANCPDGFNCSVYSIGSSLYGRELKVLKISRQGEATQRKAHWFDSLIHAREWITAATLMKIMNRLIREYGSHAEATRLLDEYDFYFLPVMNPDGYRHSWKYDRLWRKSLSRHGQCRGTDLNRNFNYEWGVSGSSNDSCSNTYRGPRPASDVETQHIQAEAKRIGRNILSWTSIHAFSQMVLIPWGSKVNGSCVIPRDIEDLMKAANAFANAIEDVYNTTWKRGTVCKTIYPATGCTIGYVKGVAGVKYTFTLELRGPGFIVPPETIEPSFNEVWAGVVAMIDEVKKLSGIQTAIQYNM